MRYRLRTLLILLAIMPPMLWLGWGKYQAWKAEQARQAALMKQRPSVIFRTPIQWRPVIAP